MSFVVVFSEFQRPDSKEGLKLAWFSDVSLNFLKIAPEKDIVDFPIISIEERLPSLVKHMEIMASLRSRFVMFTGTVSNNNLVSARIPKHSVTVRKLWNFESF